MLDLLARLTAGRVISGGIAMQKEDKERVVAELTERLRSADTLLVADYRGLTMPQIDALRGRLIEHGARLTVVKNTLTRRAAQAAGADVLLALLEGPSAIAFIESDGDPVAVAKALSDSARETRILTIRGGVMQGRTITGDGVEELAKLPPFDVLRGQVLGAVLAPLSSFAALIGAPLQNLIGLIDARIEQLGGADAAAAAPTAAEPEAAPESGEPAAEAASDVEDEPATENEPVAEAAVEDETAAEETAEDEPVAEAAEATEDEAPAESESGADKDTEPVAEAEPAAADDTETTDEEA
jgi:large subunit ribosomal protein L10